MKRIAFVGLSRDLMHRVKPVVMRSFKSSSCYFCSDLLGSDVSVASVVTCPSLASLRTRGCHSSDLPGTFGSCLYSKT